MAYGRAAAFRPMIRDLLAALDFSAVWRSVGDVVTTVVVLIVACRIALLLFGEYLHRRHP